MSFTLLSLARLPTETINRFLSHSRDSREATRLAQNQLEKKRFLQLLLVVELLVSAGHLAFSSYRFIGVACRTSVDAQATTCNAARNGTCNSELREMLAFLSREPVLSIRIIISPWASEHIPLPQRKDYIGLHAGIYGRSQSRSYNFSSHARRIFVARWQRF